MESYGLAARIVVCHMYILCMYVCMYVYIYKRIYKCNSMGRQAREDSCVLFMRVCNDRS